MATPKRTITHEDRLSLIQHLEELRTRLVVSAITLAIAFGVCLWQNKALLSIIQKPLESQTKKQVAKGKTPLGQTAILQQTVLQFAVIDKQIAALLPPSAATQKAALDKQIDLAVAKVPRVSTGDKLVTLGLGEPFTTTITVTLYFALLASLPIILFQLYGFVLPAFSPTERRIALPLMLAIPFLFAIGVVFAYFVVLPASVKFFTNFNSDQFNTLVQAGPYLKFSALIMLAMGLIFQVPVGILAATRAGIVTPKQLRANRRYAVVFAAVIAALLPGDAVTMALETTPLIVLYEISIQLASLTDRRARRREARATRDAAAREARAAEATAARESPAPPPTEPAPAPAPVAPIPLPLPPSQPPSPPSPARPADPDPLPADPPLIPPVAPPITPNEEDDDAL